jgi:small subunit ribosomal protein S20
MANTKSAKKALLVNRKKEAINKSRKNRIRTFIRKVEDFIKNNNEAEARTSFKVLEKEIMRGVTKGVFKLNTAARKLRKIAASIRKLKENKA